MKTRVCLVKHLVENTCITLTEMLSKIRVCLVKHLSKIRV